ncbi:MAG: response regulator [Sedimentisphaerales bacterium]|nr:response regulator [Sedimentisphaerales bacterium]
MEAETKRSFRILIVEDDQIDVKLLKRQLSQSRLPVTKVEQCECLKEALEQLATEQYDVVLLDMNLPDSKGLETLTAISSKYPHLTIINVTGSSDEGTALRALANGSQDYLIKCRFDPYVLSKSIQYSVERKKNELALLESTGKLNAMLEAISDHMTIIDVNLSIIRANNTAKATFGDDIVGKKCYEVFHHDKNGCMKNHCAIKEALVDGKVHQWESEVTDKNGQKRQFCSTANVVFWDQQGKPEAVIEISRDVTQTKEAQKNLVKANKELEKANREMKMMQSQLVQNEKLASIGQLAAGVAHEMNTPVGFVASNFVTLRKYIVRFQAMFGEYEDLINEIKKHKNKKYEDKIKAIEQSWKELRMDFIQEDIQSLFNESSEGFERVTSIIQNLRDFSHIDKGEDFDEYDLNKAINTTLKVAKNEIKYNAEIQTDLCETLPVWCNKGQVNQVFLNILVNAAQAIKSKEQKEKGNILIKTYARDKWGVCEISDDGTGIPPHILNKIFDPFFTTKPAGKGTGLGLSVSYDIIVNKQNGQLLVESQVDKGTKFTIKLPLSRKEQEEKILVETSTDG